MKTKEKKLTFKIPTGFDIGDKSEGDEIEAVAEFRIEKGGKLCLTKIDGILVEGYKDKEKDAEEEGFTKNVMKRSASAGD